MVEEKRGGEKGEGCVLQYNLIHVHQKYWKHPPSHPTPPPVYIDREARCDVTLPTVAHHVMVHLSCLMTGNGTRKVSQHIP